MLGKTKEEFRKINEELLGQAAFDETKVLELYFVNENFLHDFIQKYTHTADCYEDLMQLGYFALDKAVHKYLETKDTRYGFIAFYRMWLNYYFFRFNCSMQQCVRLPETEFLKLKDKYSTVEFSESLHGGSYEMESEILQKDLRDILTTEIKNSLDAKSVYIILEVFFNERSMASLGRELGMSRAGVHKRVRSSLKKLKENTKLCELASEYFGYGG